MTAHPMPVKRVENSKIGAKVAKIIPSLIPPKYSAAFKSPTGDVVDDLLTRWNRQMELWQWQVVAMNDWW